MSHAGRRRAACGMTIRSLGFHSEIREIARGVTAPGVGSGALLGDFEFSITTELTRARLWATLADTKRQMRSKEKRPFPVRGSRVRDPLAGRTTKLNRLPMPVSCSSTSKPSLCSLKMLTAHGTAEVLPNVKDEPRRDLARAVPFFRSFARRNDPHSS